MSHELVPATVLAVRSLNRSMRGGLPNEIVDTIQTHAGLAVTGSVLMSAAIYRTTIEVAWIYLIAIVSWVKKGKGSGDDLKSCINDAISQNKDQIMNVIYEEKKDYKKSY